MAENAIELATQYGRQRADQAEKLLHSGRRLRAIREMRPEESEPTAPSPAIEQTIVALSVQGSASW